MDTAELAIADRVTHQLIRLLRVSAHVRKHHADAAAHVLTRLVDAGPQRVGALADAVGTDPSTVSRQVTALVTAGLVERRADPDDGRAQLLAATAAGVQHCADGKRRRTELIATALADWPDDARHRLAELLGRFADDLHELDRRTCRRSGGES